jgi:hypothetical protein
MTNEAYVLTVDPEGSHGGKACARVAARSAQGDHRSSVAMVTQTIAAAPFRGKRVRLSGFLRTEDVTGHATMRIRVSDAAKEPLAADRNEDHAKNGTTDWTMDQMVLDVAEQAETIEYGIWLSGDGTAWIDDFALETVGTDVPSTDVMSYGPSPANLDFEGATHPRGMPLHWLGGGPGYEFVYDAESPHGGKRSAKLAWTASREPKDDDGVNFGQVVPAAAWRGKRVRFAGWVRTKDATGRGASLWLRVDDAADKSVAFDNMNGFEICGTSGWTRCEIVLDVPQSAARLTYGMLFGGGGAACCDDLALDLVSSEARCTDDPLMQTPPLADSAEKANLGFEGAAGSRGLPAGWSGGNRGFVPSVDTAILHGGKSSARLTRTAVPSSQPAPWGGISCAIPAEPYRGKRVRLAGFVRAEKTSTDPSAGAGLFMMVEGSSFAGESLAADFMQDRLLHGDADWTECAIVLDVPAAAKSLWLGLELLGPGSAWTDDLTIDVVGADVPCTDKK